MTKLEEKKFKREFLLAISTISLLFGTVVILMVVGS